MDATSKYIKIVHIICAAWMVVALIAWIVTVLGDTLPEPVFLAGLMAIKTGYIVWPVLVVAGIGWALFSFLGAARSRG